MMIDEILRRYPRVAVTGGPVTGKSIVTDAVTDRPVIHSDNIAHGDTHTAWSRHSADVKHEAEQHQRFVVAGIAADRAVRKGLEVDAIIHARRPRDRYTRGQRTLKKQIDKRVRELEARGIPVFYLD